MAIIRNVILDWSGTLVDDMAPVLSATNSIFRKYGKTEWNEAEFREKFFLPFPEFYRVYLSDVSMDEIDAIYHEAFIHLQGNIRLLPSAKEFLEYCSKETIKTYLLSTIHPAHFAEQAPRLGIEAYFTKVYTGAMDKKEVIKKLLQENQLDAAETLFIGDMQHDIAAAHSANVRGAAVLTGYDSLEKLKVYAPDLIFKGMHEAQIYLEHHRSEQEIHPIATVGALIVGSQNKLLMIQTHKWSHRWGIPGGKIKTNETAIDALHREIQEETGLDIQNVKFVMVQDCIGSTEFYRPAHFLLLNYIAYTHQSDVVLNEEAEEYRWVTFEEAMQLDLNQPTRTLLEEAKDQLNQDLSH
ncbi:MAG: NUDIX domain-containing protein [Verrucomicrobiota bacterium]